MRVLKATRRRRTSFFGTRLCAHNQKRACAHTHTHTQPSSSFFKFMSYCTHSHTHTPVYQQQQQESTTAQVSTHNIQLAKQNTYDDDEGKMEKRKVKKKLGIAQPTRGGSSRVGRDGERRQQREKTQ